MPDHESPKRPCECLLISLVFVFNSNINCVLKQKKTNVPLNSLFFQDPWRLSQQTLGRVNTAQLSQATARLSYSMLYEKTNTFIGDLIGLQQDFAVMRDYAAPWHCF